MATGGDVARTLTKDWKYYFGWWCFWVVIRTFTTLPQPSPNAEGVTLWYVTNFATAVCFGMVCAAAFTLAQNTLNIARKRWVSVALAVLIWLCVFIANFALYRALGIV